MISYSLVIFSYLVCTIFPYSKILVKVAVVFEMTLKVTKIERIQFPNFCF